jgi:hypothetical protein
VHHALGEKNFMALLRITGSLVLSLLVASAVPGQFATPPALAEQLESASVGQVLTLPFSGNGAMRMLNGFPNSLARSGGALLYSDDPETVTAPGILYRDTFAAGEVRVYLYHVSSLGGSMRFSVVLENPGLAPITITPTHRAVAAPTGNYVRAGRELSQLAFQSQALPPSFTIPAGGRALLDSGLDATPVSTNQLLPASLDFQSSGQVRVSTVMVAAGVDTITAFPQLTFSPNDGRERQGTFLQNLRTTPAAGYRWNASEGMVRLRIGEGATALNDPPAQGTDAERANTPVTLPGNYGVLYDTTITYNNDTGERGAILLNPRGGSYGGWFSATVNGSVVGEGLVPSATLNVPPTTGAGVIALMDAGPGTHELRLQFTPAGASSLPIEILFAPYTVVPPPDPTHGWMLVGTVSGGSR